MQIRRTLLPALLAALGTTVSLAVSTDTSFTYQGDLRDGGEPASGSYDMSFGIWDAASGGSPMGSPIMLDGVGVSGGKFTVELDFGADVFDDDDRWLEISVEGFTLDPRQAMTRAPFSIQTRGIFVNDAGQIGIGTTEPQRNLDLEAPEPTLRMTATDPAAGISARLQFKGSAGPPLFHPLGAIDFYDDADGLRAMINSVTAGPDTASMNLNVTPGEFPQLQLLSSTVRMRDELEVRRGTDLELAASIGSDGEDSFFQLQGGHFGIGTDEPLYPLHVTTDEDVIGAIVGRHNGPGTFRVGVYGQTTNASGAGVYGGGVGDAVYGVFGESFREGGGVGVYGWARGFSGVNYGVIGISSSSVGYDFMAWGDGMDYGSNSSGRWKRNVENIPQPLESLAQLRGVFFDWDEDHGGRHDIGMIAEEVGEILPEIVAYEENGVDAVGMDYSKLTPLLVEAVNALRGEKDAEIESLRVAHDAELQLLRTENEDLRARLGALERSVQRLMSERSGGAR